MKAKIAILYPLRHISVGKRKKRKIGLAERVTELPWPRLHALNHGCLLASGAHYTTLSRAEGQLRLRESFLHIIVLPDSPSLGQGLSAFHDKLLISEVLI